MEEKTIVNITRYTTTTEMKALGVFEPKVEDKNLFISQLSIDVLPEPAERQAVIQRRAKTIADIAYLEYPSAEGALIGDVSYMKEPLAEQLRNNFGENFRLLDWSTALPETSNQDTKSDNDIDTDTEELKALSATAI